MWEGLLGHPCGLQLDDARVIAASARKKHVTCSSRVTAVRSRLLSVVISLLIHLLHYRKQREQQAEKEQDLTWRQQSLLEWRRILKGILALLKTPSLEQQL